MSEPLNDREWAYDEALRQLDQGLGKQAEGLPALVVGVLNRRRAATGLRYTRSWLRS